MIAISSPTVKQKTLVDLSPPLSQTSHSSFHQVAFTISPQTMDNQILTFGAKTRTGNFYLLFTRDPDGFFFCPCGHVSQDSSEMQDHVQICRLAEGILEYKRFTGRTLYEPTWEVKAQEVSTCISIFNACRKSCSKDVTEN